MKPLFLIVAFLFTSLAAHAQPLILPDTFVVTGVAADDTLNVRQQPSGSSADIGDLYPNQLVEVIAVSDNDQWGQIIWHEGNGWISMRFLAPEPYPQMDDSVMPIGISCLGNEPFWSATILRNQMFEFSDIGALPQMRPVQHSTSALNMPPYLFAFTAGEFTGVLERAQCFDGMSDITYGWQLRLISTQMSGLVLRNGCCRVAK